MRRATAALATALVVAVLAGCGDVNKGSAFASEFQAFLDSRDDLAVAEARGTNPLPWSGTGDVTIQVVDGLSDDEVVDEVWAITHHEVDNQVAYSLEVRFPTQTSTGSPALAAFHVGVPDPAPEDQEAELREDLAGRLDLARQLVGPGIGPTEASADAESFRLRSQGDALTVAAALCDDPGLERVVDAFTIEGPAVGDTGQGGRPGSLVTLSEAGDCAWLADVVEILTLVGAPGAVASYSTQQAVYDDLPNLRVTLAPGASADLAAAAARALDLGVTLVVL